MKIQLQMKTTARLLTVALLLTTVNIGSFHAPASATVISKIWFKQLGTIGSVRPSSEAAGSLVRQGTFNTSQISNANLETLTVTCSTGLNPHWNAPFDPQEVIVDYSNNKLYWHNRFEPAVVQSDLDGSNCERIVDDNYYAAAGIALDSAGQHLYTIYQNSIRKVNIAGKTNSTLTITGDSFTAGDSLWDLVVDGNILYVSTNTSSAGSGRIVKVDLTTFVASNLIVGQAQGMRQMALDKDNNKIYWANATSKTLSSANLSDGSNIQTIRTSTKEIWSVAIDTANSKLFIGERGTGAGPIVRTDLDGSNASSIGYIAASYLTIVNGSGGGGSGGGGSAPDSQAESEAARKKSEEDRAALIKIAREKLKSLVVAKEPITSAGLAAAGEPVLSEQMMVELNKRLLNLNPSVDTKYEEITFQVIKYKNYDQIAGNMFGRTYPRDLITYGVIGASYPMKSLALHKLMRLPLQERDSVLKIDAFLSAEAERTANLKARLLARSR